MSLKTSYKDSVILIGPVKLITISYLAILPCYIFSRAYWRICIWMLHQARGDLIRLDNWCTSGWFLVYISLGKENINKGLFSPIIQPPKHFCVFLNLWRYISTKQESKTLDQLGGGGGGRGVQCLMLGNRVLTSEQPQPCSDHVGNKQLPHQTSCCRAKEGEQISLFLVQNKTRVNLWFQVQNNQLPALIQKMSWNVH